MVPIWAARLETHIKRAALCLGSDCLFLTKIGPNISTLEYVSGPASMQVCWNHNFLLSLKHMTHLQIICSTIEFALMVHTPLLLRWFKFNPFSQCPTHRWLNCIIISEILNFFNRITGWVSSFVKHEFFNLPPSSWCFSCQEIVAVLQWDFPLE